MTVPTPAASRFSATLDDLVAGARSARDGLFNTLDAVSRRTEAASAQLAAEAERLVVERRAAQERDAAAADPRAERDTRFDPEDEWELPSHDALSSGAKASNAPRAAPDEDDESGPETWLR